MSAIHVFRADSQPFTRYNLDVTTGKPHWVRHNKRHQFECFYCGRKRYAKNLRIQVYYDALNVFCADGCKEPTK